MDMINIERYGVIGKRALFKPLCGAPREDRLMEVSPSGEYVRFERNGWEEAAAETFVELLESAESGTSGAPATSETQSAAKTGAFTPEEVADLPFNMDITFSP